MHGHGQSGLINRSLRFSIRKWPVSIRQIQFAMDSNLGVGKALLKSRKSRTQREQLGHHAIGTMGHQASAPACLKPAKVTVGRVAELRVEEVDSVLLIEGEEESIEEESVEAPWLACETSWSSDGAFNAAPGPSLTTCSVFPLRSELCEGFASSKFADSAGGNSLWSSGASAAGLASADVSGLFGHLNYAACNDVFHEIRV